MPKKILLLLKVFDKEEYADAFLQSGEMFCKTIGDFKRIEGDAARGDKFEAPSQFYQPDRVSMVISFTKPDGEVKSFPVDGLAGPLVMQATAHDRLNVFCMYAFTVPDFEESYTTEEERLQSVERINSLLKVHAQLSEEMLSFGGHAVLITNVSEFFDKVNAAALSDGSAIYRGLVDYYDPETFHGSFGEVEAVFKKRKEYSYQKEFRFVFDSGKPYGARSLRAGSLAGIAFKLKTSEINRLELKLYEGERANKGSAG